MIELDKVSKVYRLGKVEIPALREVTLRVERGESLAVMGPSGSGKSTLLHIMGCLDRPTSGTYRFGGEDVSRLGDRELAHIRNCRVGFVFQSFHLLWNETALQNVMLPLRYSGADGKRRRAAEALQMVGLAERLRHKPGELSGGEQQRVAIARAMVKEPEVILADEPTGNLDSEAGQNILSIFRGLNERGVMVVLITHERSVAETCRRIVYIKDGRLGESP